MKTGKDRFFSQEFKFLGQNLCHLKMTVLDSRSDLQINLAMNVVFCKTGTRDSLTVNESLLCGSKLFKNKIHYFFRIFKILQIQPPDSFFLAKPGELPLGIIA